MTLPKMWDGDARGEWVKEGSFWILVTLFYEVKDLAVNVLKVTSKFTVWSIVYLGQRVFHIFASEKLESMQNRSFCFRSFHGDFSLRQILYLIMIIILIYYPPCLTYTPGPVSYNQMTPYVSSIWIGPLLDLEG
jgi:hypothetical protein